MKCPEPTGTGPIGGNEVTMEAAGLRSWRLYPLDAFGPVGCDPHLASRSVRGGALTLCGQGGSFMIMTLWTIILARLLTPADFGLIGMVIVVIAFASPSACADDSGAKSRIRTVGVKFNLRIASRQARGHADSDEHDTARAGCD